MQPIKFEKRKLIEGTHHRTRKKLPTKKSVWKYKPVNLVAIKTFSKKKNLLVDYKFKKM